MLYPIFTLDDGTVFNITDYIIDGNRPIHIVKYHEEKDKRRSTTILLPKKIVLARWNYSREDIDKLIEIFYKKLRDIYEEHRESTDEKYDSSFAFSYVLGYIMEIEKSIKKVAKYFMREDSTLTEEKAMAEARRVLEGVDDD